jgi:hypothetical protein
MNRFRILAILFILATVFWGNPRTAYAFCMEGSSCSGGQVCYEGRCRTCVLPGDVDDVLYATDCCSGAAVPGSTYCNDPADYGTTWASCYQICA